MKTPQFIQSTITRCQHTKPWWAGIRCMRWFGMAWGHICAELHLLSSNAEDGEEKIIAVKDGRQTFIATATGKIWNESLEIKKIFYFRKP